MIIRTEGVDEEQVSGSTACRAHEEVAEGANLRRGIPTPAEEHRRVEEVAPCRASRQEFALRSTFSSVTSPPEASDEA